MIEINREHQEEQRSIAVQREPSKLPPWRLITEIYAIRPRQIVADLEFSDDVTGRLIDFLRSEGEPAYGSVQSICTDHQIKAPLPPLSNVTRAPSCF